MIYKAKFGWILKDSNIRRNYAKAEMRKNILRNLLSASNSYKFCYKYYFSKLFYDLSATTAISKYRSGCSFSIKGRVIFRDFKMSRLFCKYFASNGYLMGLRKSSF